MQLPLHASHGLVAIPMHALFLENRLWSFPGRHFLDKSTECSANSIHTPPLSFANYSTSVLPMSILNTSHRRKNKRIMQVNAKCRHLKKWPVKGLRGRCLSKFILYVDWRYPVSCVHSIMLVFSTQHCELLPLSPSLYSSTLPPLPVWITVLYTRIECVSGGGGYLGFWASDRYTPAAKSL